MTGSSLPSRRTRVLFVPSWYPDDEHPARGIFVQKHAEAVARFCDVVVLDVRASERPLSRPVEVSMGERAGIQTCVVRYRTSKGMPGRMLLPNFARDLAASLYGFRALGPQRFDLVHAHVTFPAAVRSLLIAEAARLPYLVTEHWTGYLAEDGAYRGARLRALTRLGLARAAVITTVSRCLADAMQAHGLSGNYRVVGNVAEGIAVRASNTRSSDGLIHFVHVSLLDDRGKNISGLLRVLEKLARRRRDFRMHVFGGGPSEAHLRRQVADRGLQDLVIFEGLTPHAALLERLPAFAFLVMFSNYETFCVAAAEAIASGLPVIATNVGGPPEFIREDVGVLVPPRDEGALLEAIEHMLEHHQDYDGVALARYAQGRFSRSAVGEAFASIYAEILERHARD